MSTSLHSITDLYESSLSQLPPIYDGTYTLSPSGRIDIEMMTVQRERNTGLIIIIVICALLFMIPCIMLGNVLFVFAAVAIFGFFLFFASNVEKKSWIKLHIDTLYMKINGESGSSTKNGNRYAVSSSFQWNKYYIKWFCDDQLLTVIVGDQIGKFYVPDVGQREWLNALFEYLNFPAWVPKEEKDFRKKQVREYGQNESPLRPYPCLNASFKTNLNGKSQPSTRSNALPGTEFVYDPGRYIDAVVPNDTTPSVDAVLQNPPVFDDDNFRPAPPEHAALNGKYHNLTPIGGGAQASMFRALDNQNQPVGIKVFDFSTFQSWKDQELFEREVKILQNLDFKGIPRFIEWIDNSPYYYLVESYIPAPSLEKRIKNGEQIAFDNILILLVNIAEILNYLETRLPPVIHRDIKPENLLVDDAFNVWLVDFGVVAAEAQKTNAMTFAGTAGYMAPEQVMGKVSPAADIYAVGISILTLLTGKTPANMKFQQLAVDVRAELPSHLPEWFRRLLIDMTNPYPNKRIQNAAQIIGVIMDYISYKSLSEFTGDENLINAAGNGNENAVYDREYMTQQLAEKNKRENLLQL